MTRSFQPRLSAGFTLMEAVLTLLLLAVLSAAATGLFADKEVFSGRVLADRLNAQLLSAQQLALARGIQGTVSVDLRLIATTLRMRMTQGALQSDSTVSAQGLTLGWSQTAVGACGAGLQNLPLVLRYQADGTMLAPAGANRNVLICADQYPVCVTAGGHAYAGTCS